MKNQGRYRHLRVDWVGESSSESITLCGVEGEDIGTGQTLCPDCAQVADALHVCGLGPESLRELFDTLRVIGPSEVKAKMEALRVLGGGGWICRSGRNSTNRVSPRASAQARLGLPLPIGLGVVEHEPEGKAAAEIRKLLASGSPGKTHRQPINSVGEPPDRIGHSEGGQPTARGMGPSCQGQISPGATPRAAPAAWTRRPNIS